MSIGVLYIATGEKYVNEAIESAKSLKKTNDLPISIVISKPQVDLVEGSVFDKIITIDNPYYDIRDKVHNIQQTPYDKTLFLDGDTFVVGNIESVFNLLERYNIAAPFSTTRVRVDDDVPDSFSELGTAVLAYDSSEETSKFLSEWVELHKNQIKSEKNADLRDQLTSTSFGIMHGQVPFRRALYQSEIRFVTLPSEYCFGGFARCYADNEVKIIHGSPRHYLRPVINQYMEKRIVVRDKMYLQNKSTPIRIYGVPIIHEIKKRVPARRISKSLGIYEPAQKSYRKLSKLFNN